MFLNNTSSHTIVKSSINDIYQCSVKLALVLLEVHVSVPVQCELDPGSDKHNSLEVHVSVPV